MNNDTIPTLKYAIAEYFGKYFSEIKFHQNSAQILMEGLKEDNIYKWKFDLEEINTSTMALHHFLENAKGEFERMRTQYHNK